MLFERIFGPRTPPALPVVHLSVGPQSLPLLMVRNPRARRYLLRLRPDGTARVTIPRGGSTAAARQFVERHAAWLERELQRLQAQPRKPAAWNIGTEILLRGDAVRIEAGFNGKTETVRFGGESVRVSGSGRRFAPGHRRPSSPTGHAGIATARAGAGRPARIDRAPHHGAQPEIALGFLFTARHDFPELAAHPDTRFRKRLHLPARTDAFAANESLARVLAGNGACLSRLPDGQTLVEGTLRVVAVIVFPSDFLKGFMSKTPITPKFALSFAGIRD